MQKFIEKIKDERERMRKTFYGDAIIYLGLIAFLIGIFNFVEKVSNFKFAVAYVIYLVINEIIIKWKDKNELIKRFKFITPFIQSLFHIFVIIMIIEKAPRFILNNIIRNANMTNIMQIPTTTDKFFELTSSIIMVVIAIISFCLFKLWIKERDEKYWKNVYNNRILLFICSYILFSFLSDTFSLNSLIELILSDFWSEMMSTLVIPITETGLNPEVDRLVNPRVIFYITWLLISAFYPVFKNVYKKLKQQ